MAQYIAVKQYGNKVFIPHTAGRYQKKRFRKSSCPIVERLVCSLMMHGRNNGKKLMATRIVKHTFEIIHLLTDENPIQVGVERIQMLKYRCGEKTLSLTYYPFVSHFVFKVLVNAVVNSGPREDSTRIGSAGTVRRQAVDVSPLRRVNVALYLLTTGAREAAFRSIKTIAECLADELINAAKGSSNSYAIKKKDEVERVAKANR